MLILTRKKMLCDENAYVVYRVIYKLTCVVFRGKNVQKSVLKKKDIKFKNSSCVDQ